MQSFENNNGRIENNRHLDRTGAVEITKLVKGSKQTQHKELDKQFWTDILYEYGCKTYNDNSKY